MKKVIASIVLMSSAFLLQGSDVVGRSGASGAPAGGCDITFDDIALTELRGIIQKAAGLAGVSIDVSEEKIPNIDALAGVVSSTPPLKICRNCSYFCAGQEWNVLADATCAFIDGGPEEVGRRLYGAKEDLCAVVLEGLRRCQTTFYLRRLAEAFGKKGTPAERALDDDDVKTIIERLDIICSKKGRTCSGRDFVAGVVKDWNTTKDVEKARGLLIKCAGALELNDLVAVLSALNWFELFTSYESLIERVSSGRRVDVCRLSFSPSYSAAGAPVEKPHALPRFDEHLVPVGGGAVSGVPVSDEKLVESFKILTKACKRLAPHSELFLNLLSLLSCRSRMTQLCSSTCMDGSFDEALAFFKKITAVGSGLSGCSCEGLEQDEKDAVGFMRNVVLPWAIEANNGVMFRTLGTANSAVPFPKAEDRAGAAACRDDAARYIAARPATLYTKVREAFNILARCCERFKSADPEFFLHLSYLLSYRVEVEHLLWREPTYAFVMRATSPRALLREMCAIAIPFEGITIRCLPKSEGPEADGSQESVELRADGLQKSVRLRKEEAEALEFITGVLLSGIVEVLKSCSIPAPAMARSSSEVPTEPYPAEETAEREALVAEQRGDGVPGPEVPAADGESKYEVESEPEQEFDGVPSDGGVNAVCGDE